MSLTPKKLFVANCVCAMAILGSGCSVPWSLPDSRHNESAELATATNNGAADVALPRTINSAEAKVSTMPAEASEPTESDLSGVLDKLMQIRAIDPAAEQRLMAELRKAPPNSWPLVAEQFRASLAYREQLATKRTAPQHSASQAELTSRNSARASDDSPTGLVVESRPSAPIGQLVDPRNADSDGISSEAIARSTPYSMSIGGQETPPRDPAQSVPAEFASDGPSYPIRENASGNENSPGIDETVRHARFESAGEPQTLAAVSERAPPAPPRGTDWNTLVDMAADDLSRRVATSPTTTAEVHQHVSLRLLYLLTGDTERALEPIPHISPSEQDYWSRQVFALATYLDHHSQPDDKRRAAASVMHLDQAVSSLRELGPLSLRNLSFCKNVYGYGAIEPCDQGGFSPGQQVTVYVEVENYHSVATDKGHRTALGSSYEILTEDGTRVSGGEIPDVEDYCRARRRDFHIQYSLALPETISPGKYRLQLVIKDRQSDKIGSATATFEVRGGAR
jgi:hypothetical protein